jgi:hypothetical protein
MTKLFLFALIAKLACQMVDYWSVVGTTFLSKILYEQAWSIVWHDALAVQVLTAAMIVSMGMVGSIRISK